MTPKRRNVPEAVIRFQPTCASFDRFVSLDEQRGWHDEAQRSRSLAIYEGPDGLPSTSTELIF